MGRPREFDIEEALDAATVAFWERGYEATSMADLMEAMGLQKGSIYKAFGDKHSLFVQALSRYLDKGFRVFRDALSGGDSPGEGVRRWIDAITCSCSEDAGRRGCFGVNSVNELGPHDNEVAARLERHFERMEAALAEKIAEGQEAGEFRRDVKAAELAEFLMIYVTGMLTRSKGPCCRDKVRHMADFAMTVLS